MSYRHDQGPNAKNTTFGQKYTQEQLDAVLREFNGTTLTNVPAMAAALLDAQQEVKALNEENAALVNNVHASNNAAMENGIERDKATAERDAAIKERDEARAQFAVYDQWLVDMHDDRTAQLKECQTKITDLRAQLAEAQEQLACMQNLLRLTEECRSKWCEDYLEIEQKLAKVLEWAIEIQRGPHNYEVMQALHTILDAPASVEKPRRSLWCVDADGNDIDIRDESVKPKADSDCSASSGTPAKVEKPRTREVTREVVLYQDDNGEFACDADTGVDGTQLARATVTFHVPVPEVEASAKLGASGDSVFLHIDGEMLAPDGRNYLTPEQARALRDALNQLELDTEK